MNTTLTERERPVQPAYDSRPHGLGLACGICLVLAGVLVGTVRADAFDRTAAEGAAKIVLDSISADVLAGGRVAETNLTATLLADPGAYKTANAAREALKACYQKNLEARYATEAQRVLARLARPRRAEEAFTASFRTAALALPAGAAEKSVQAAYPAIYAKARATACAEQVKVLKATVRPTEVEFDTVAVDRLRAELVTRLAANQQTPVFEENVAYISEKIVGPMLEEAKRQRAAQENDVRHAEVAGYAPAVLEQAYVRHLTDWIATQRKEAKAGAWVYGAFPSVTNAVVRECAVKTVARRAADGVADAQIPLDEKTVLEAFAREPAKHKRRDASEKAFAEQLTEQVRAAALDAVCARAPEAERDPFRAAVQQLDGRSAFAQAVRRKVTDELMPEVRRIRAAGATKQFETAFPTLADVSWHPDGATTDAFCERHDYNAAVKGWREQEALATLAAAGKGKEFLEEADALADDGVKRAFERARSARTAQLKDVQRAGASLLRKWQTAVDGGEAIPKLDEVVKELTEDVEQLWQDQHDKVVWAGVQKKPANADEQHAALFPSVRERITEKAKALLESLAKPKEPDAPSSSEELMPVEMPCEIVLDYAHGRITAELLVDGKSRKKASCEANPEKYLASVQKMRAELAGDLRQALKTRKGTESVKFGVIVRNDFVYCGTAEALLRALAEAAGAEGVAISTGSDTLNWKFGR